MNKVQLCSLTSTFLNALHEAIQCCGKYTLGSVEFIQNKSNLAMKENTFWNCKKKQLPQSTQGH